MSDKYRVSENHEKICIGRANGIPVMRSANISGSFMQRSYVLLANTRQISRRRRRRTRGRSILSRCDSWRELVPVTDIYRVRSRHNFERGSTKKIDGKDFTVCRITVMRKVEMEKKMIK